MIVAAVMPSQVVVPAVYRLRVEAYGLSFTPVIQIPLHRYECIVNLWPASTATSNSGKIQLCIDTRSAASSWSILLLGQGKGIPPAVAYISLASQRMQLADELHNGLS